MEAGRDDFIIAIRSAFLKKENKQRFSLLGLIFFSIIFLILGKLNFTAIDYVKISIREIVYRSFFVVSIPENYVKKIYVKLDDHLNYYNKYLDTEAKLKKLQSEKIDNNFIINENKRLKKIIDDYFMMSDGVLAKIIVDKQSPFLRSIIINKGSKDNIKLSMAVLDDRYLIGKVVEVNFLTSRVLLLSDLNSKIPTIIEPGGFQSILSGTGRDNGIIEYSKEKYLIKDGSLVYTSGAGGVYKNGIPIGKIKESNKEGVKEVDFLSDFSQLKFVRVVSFDEELPSKDGEKILIKKNQKGTNN